MKFRHELNYSASPADVFAMLSDQAYREKVGSTRGVVSSDITITQEGDGFTMVSDEVTNTAGVPAIAKKITGDTTRAVITETWSSPTAGTLSIETPGKPTSAAGTCSLVDGADGGTTRVIELEVKVKVPLVGGKIEAIMADQMREGYETEQQVGDAWLAGER